MNVSNTTDIETRIEGSIDKEAMGLTEISQSVGGLAFKDMGQVMEFAKLMAVSRQAVPKHLRGQAGACMAVSLQALNWRMDPFAVANKSYMVNDRIVYEAQLIQAVIEQRAPIKGRIKGSYEGTGAKRVCVLKVVSEEDDDTIEYRSPEIGSITTKNSPLWKSDPDQQLWYYSARAMCRRHFPDVLLGVYEKDEIKDSESMRDVTPQAQGGWANKARAARGEVMPEETIQQAEVDIPEAEDVEFIPPEEATAPEPQTFDEDAVDPMTDEYDEGFKASKSGESELSPYEEGSEDWNNWIGGYRFQRENHKVAQEGGEA